MQKSKSGALHERQVNLSQANRGGRYTRSEERVRHGKGGSCAGLHNRPHPTPQVQGEGFVQNPIVEDGEGWITVRRRSPKGGVNNM